MKRIGILAEDLAGGCLVTVDYSQKAGFPRIAKCIYSVNSCQFKRRYETWTFFLECPSFIPSLFMLKPTIHADFGIFYLYSHICHSDVQTLKNHRIKTRKTAFEPPCLFFFRCLSIIIQGFIGVWRSIPQRGMWTLHIIEIHVFPDVFFEFFHRMIVPSI